MADYSKIDLGFLVLALCKAVQELSAENERLQLIVDGKTFVTQELASPWISVKEYKPEIGQKVFVYCVDAPGNTYMEVMTFDWDMHGGYCWYEQDGDFWGGEVTHWMPLPSPPQEAQEEP